MGEFLKLSKRLYGIYDLRYAPYALGDVLTFVANLQSLAVLKKCSKVSLLIALTRDNPSNKIQKHKVTIQTYPHAILNLYPAFLCGSEIDEISFLENRRHLNKKFFQSLFSKNIFVWPNIFNHSRQHLKYWSHSPMNEAFKKFGYFPRLNAPKGYEDSYKKILEHPKSKGKIPIAVNIRQRALTSDPAAVHRDSNIEVWKVFFDACKIKHPQYCFFILGGYDEWERKLYNFENLLIPRAFGFGLVEELSLLFKSKLFMGTNSGFANAAAFSNIPHLITSIEDAHAAHADIKVGDVMHPFAGKNQVLLWEKETPQNLMYWFEKLTEQKTDLIE